MLCLKRLYTCIGSMWGKVIFDLSMILNISLLRHPTGNAHGGVPSWAKPSSNPSGTDVCRLGGKLHFHSISLEIICVISLLDPPAQRSLTREMWQGMLFAPSQFLLEFLRFLFHPSVETAIEILNFKNTTRVRVYSNVIFGSRSRTSWATIAWNRPLSRNGGGTLE